MDLEHIKTIYRITLLENISKLEDSIMEQLEENNQHTTIDLAGEIFDLVKQEIKQMFEHDS